MPAPLPVRGPLAFAAILEHAGFLDHLLRPVVARPVLDVAYGYLGFKVPERRMQTH